jgi:LPXTG-motif cell wall-anchored protein
LATPKLHKKTIAGVAAAAIAAIALFVTVNASAVQPTVNLGNAQTFAVMAGSGITNTGPTTLSGTWGSDIGSSPTGTFTGSASVTTSGTKYIAADPATAAAQSALTTAYLDAAGRTPATTVSADLGGQTLTQGVYNSASSLGLTGTLILDAENDPAAVFIFQAGSTLTTASGSKVELINGAQACNVFWQVGSSATFGTTTDFTGHVLALTSITANNGATFKGQLLARNGAVTLDTNTIINDACVTVTPTATATPTASETATATPTESATESPAPEETMTAAPSETPSPEDTTDAGGQLPDTETDNWILPLGIGLAVIAIGAIVFFLRRKAS